MATSTVPLSDDQIAALLGSVSERGKYGRILDEFMQSDESGIVVSTAFPSTTKPGTIYQGFTNQRKEKNLTDRVRVLNHEDTVYLIKT